MIMKQDCSLILIGIYSLFHIDMFSRVFLRLQREQ